MGRKRTPMSEGKKNIISMLLEEYDIQSEGFATCICPFTKATSKQSLLNKPL